MSAKKRLDIEQDNQPSEMKNRPRFVVLRSVAMIFVVMIAAGLLAIYALNSANDVFEIGRAHV